MKNNLILCLLLASAGVFAQKDQTMFSNVDRIGGWGAPLFEYSNLGSDDVNVTGGGGGALVLNDFYLGGYGMGKSEFSKSISAARTGTVSFKHGGFWIGYVPLQGKVIHPYTSVRLGWGKANYRVLNDVGDIVSQLKDNVFVTTPEAGLELNVFSFFRIVATASYRWVNGVNDLEGFSDDELSGFGGTLTLRFGGFGRDDWDD